MNIFIDTVEQYSGGYLSYMKGILSETAELFGFWNNWNSPTTSRTIMPHIIKFFKFIL